MLRVDNISKTKSARTIFYWRRRQDSNLRTTFKAVNSLAVSCFRPLSHASTQLILAQIWVFSQLCYNQFDIVTVYWNNAS